MKLNRLLEQAGREDRGAEDAIVTGFAIDHRKVAPGTVFGAFAGAKVNGEDFIDAAVAASAIAVVARPGAKVEGALHIADVGGTITIHAGRVPDEEMISLRLGVGRARLRAIELVMLLRKIPSFVRMQKKKRKRGNGREETNGCSMVVVRPKYLRSEAGSVASHYR